MPRSMKVTFNNELTGEEVDIILSNRGIEKAEKGLASEIHNTLLMNFRKKGDGLKEPQVATPTSTKEKALV